MVRGLCSDWARKRAKRSIGSGARAIVIRPVFRRIGGGIGGLIRRVGEDVNVKCLFYDQSNSSCWEGDPSHEAGPAVGAAIEAGEPARCGPGAGLCLLNG